MTSELAIAISLGAGICIAGISFIAGRITSGITQTEQRLSAVRTTLNGWKAAYRELKAERDALAASRAKSNANLTAGTIARQEKAREDRHARMEAAARRLGEADVAGLI